MNQPRRLLESQGETTEFERRLLESVAGERPSARLTRRMLAGTLAAGAMAPSAGLAMILKGSAAAALVVVGTAGAVAMLDRERAVEEPAPIVERGERGASVVAPPAPSNPPQAPDSPQGVISEPLSGGPSKNGEPASNAAPRAVSTGKPASMKVQAKTGATSLRDEVALLDQARASLRAGAPERALEQLALYDRKFPSGTLHQESVLLRQRAHELISSQSGSRR